MDQHRSGSARMTIVVDNAAVIDLNDRRPATAEQRWPITWTVLLALTLSAGLWAAIFLGARAAITFLTQV